MINSIKSYLLIFILSILYTNAKSQTIGVGASGIYNFQSESFGAGVRGSVFPNKRLSVVPQFSYFFGPKVKEYTIGLGLEGKFIKREKLIMYAILHGGYNKWISYQESGLKNAQPVNWNFEGGIGITTNTCLRPFLEYRYNVKFKETHLNLGFLYIFGCRNNRYVNDKCPTFK